MTVTNSLKNLAIAIATLCIARSLAQDRIWLNDAKINGKPVKLIFDSGANVNALSPEAVKRLGLKVNNVPTNDFPGFVASVTDHERVGSHFLHLQY